MGFLGRKSIDSFEKLSGTIQNYPELSKAIQNLRKLSGAIFCYLSIKKCLGFLGS